MNEINLHTEIHKFELSMEMSRTIDKTIHKHINIPTLDQIIIPGGYNISPFYDEHLYIMFNNLPIKYIYNKHLNNIISYNGITTYDFMCIFEIKEKNNTPRNIKISLENFKFYIIKKDSIIKINLEEECGKNYKNVEFGHISKNKDFLFMKILAFSSYFKYTNKIISDNNTIFRYFLQEKLIETNEYEMNRNVSFDIEKLYENMIIDRKIITKSVFYTCCVLGNTLQISYQNYSDVNMRNIYNNILRSIVLYTKNIIDNFDPLILEYIKNKDNSNLLMQINNINLSVL